VTKQPEGRVMTLTQKWRYLNLIRKSLSYRQIISRRLYIRFKRTCSLAGRALLNTGENNK